MRLFHRTTKEAAAAILATGFRDASAQPMNRGVWLSSVPSEADERTQVLLIVELAISDNRIASFEWWGPGIANREFLIPAALVNAHGSVRRATPEEVAWPPRSSGVMATPERQPELKFTRQEMDAELDGLARRTIALLTEKARQSILDGTPDGEVEQAMNAWKDSPKAVCEELLHRGLIAEVRKMLWRERLR